MKKITERANAAEENLIVQELEKASIPLGAANVQSAWIKGKHVSVHITPEPIISRPYRIAFVDIETAPNLGYTWGKYEQNVIQFQKEWFLLSFAVKWQGDKKTKVYALCDYPGYNEDKSNDAQLTAELWKVLDEADLVIAHNGDKFDMKKANARFLQHGMSPPAPYRTVDTLKVARRNFALTSNKLDDVAQVLGLGKKVKTGGFDLWLQCMEGDLKAWALMKKYNAKDVDLLEEVYDRLRPWHMSHPHISETANCPACGSSDLMSRGYGFRSNGTKKPRYQCKDCAKWC